MKLQPADIEYISAQSFLPLRLRSEHHVEQISEHPYELQIIKLWLRLTPDEREVADEAYEQWVQTLGTYAWGKGSDDFLLDFLWSFFESEVTK